MWLVKIVVSSGANKWTIAHRQSSMTIPSSTHEATKILQRVTWLYKEAHSTDFVVVIVGYKVTRSWVSVWYQVHYGQIPLKPINTTEHHILLFELPNFCQTVCLQILSSALPDVVGDEAYLVKFYHADLNGTTTSALVRVSGNLVQK